MFKSCEQCGKIMKDDANPGMRLWKKNKKPSPKASTTRITSGQDLLTFFNKHLTTAFPVLRMRQVLEFYMSPTGNVIGNQIWYEFVNIKDYVIPIELTNTIDEKDDVTKQYRLMEEEIRLQHLLHVTFELRKSDWAKYLTIDEFELANRLAHGKSIADPDFKYLALAREGLYEHDKLLQDDKFGDLRRNIGAMSWEEVKDKFDDYVSRIVSEYARNAHGNGGIEMWHDLLDILPDPLLVDNDSFKRMERDIRAKYVVALFRTHWARFPLLSLRDKEMAIQIANGECIVEGFYGSRLRQALISSGQRDI